MSTWGPGTTAYREALEVHGAARRVGDGAWLLEPFAPPSVCPACAEAYRINYVIAQGRLCGIALHLLPCADCSLWFS
jgi:hypothetical protein